jgi:hypothetical protein
MFDSSANIYFAPCLHRRVITESSGGRHFSEGEVWDDIQERLLCLDCMEYVTEAEVHSAWGQETQQIPAKKERISDDNK